MAAADLLEAEGRLLRRNALRTALAVGLGLAAVTLALAGTGLVLLALHTAADAHWGAVPAALLTALGAFGAAGGFLWLSLKTNR